MASDDDLPASVYDALLRAGWTPGRSHDTARFAERLRSRGFPVFASALELVRRFGGLVIRYPGPVLGMRSPMTCVLGEDAITNAEPGRYDDDVGESLSPVGTVENGNVDVWMTADGRVLIAHGYLVLLGGNSAPEFLERICSGLPFEPFNETSSSASSSNNDAK